MPDQEIIDRLSILEADYRSYVTSNMPSVIAYSLAEHHELDQVKAIALENAIILLLIFKMSPSQFTEFIVGECHVDHDDALSVYNAVLLALPRDIAACFENTLHQIASAAVQQPMTATPKYTEPVYTTTQSAILQEAQIPPPPPAPPAAPAFPRWDSE